MSLASRAAIALAEARAAERKLAVPVGPRVTVKPAAKAFRERATPMRMPVRLERDPPAPPVRALPAPGPGLPPHAVKPRGGDWASPTTHDVLYGFRGQPPEAITEDLGYNVEDHRDFAYDVAHRNWLDRNLVKYLKNDLGTPDDPLHALWERGVTHFPEMYDGTPPWSKIAKQAIADKPFSHLVGPDADPRDAAELLQAAPWMAKKPVTDKLYGLTSGASRRMQLDHLSDELHNALYPNSGLPDHLRLDPASMPRLSVPDAVQRVHEINKWRAENVAEANAARSKNAAVHVFKEYPDDNPKGLHWAELRLPDPSDDLLDDFDKQLIAKAHEEGRTIDPEHMEEVMTSRQRRALEDALKYEGDTMGHCVGGYCHDVASGNSRIFSLRDAKGEPHVTIETQPQRDTYSGFGNALNEIEPGVWDKIVAHPDFYPDGGDAVAAKHFPEVWEKFNTPSIVQIKGKANLAPKDDYLPFVQDFVRSQKWSNVGDAKNARMVKLPDDRYITHDDMRKVLLNLPNGDDIEWGPAHRNYWEDTIKDRLPDPEYNPVREPLPRQFDKVEWPILEPYFKGYAIGGRVEDHRDFAAAPRIRVFLP